MPSGEIEKLISYFARFPGMGMRSASRIVLHLLRRNSVMSSFIKTLETVHNTSKVCEICGNIDVSSPCHICQDHKRDQNIVCVVADISDLWSIERANFYKGRYCVLGNKLSAINGISPEDLNIDKLRNMIISNSEIKEVVIALSADLDGQTTLFFVNDRISDLNVKVTTLSHGVPVGSELEYLDDGTIITAFNQRRDIG